MQAAVEGEVLGRGQRGARAGEPLGHRIVGTVENTTERSSAAPSAKRLRRKAASRSVTPIAANTTTNPSSEPRTRAPWAIRGASSSPGRP